jgi:hypothetical protein
MVILLARSVRGDEYRAGKGTAKGDREFGGVVAQQHHTVSRIDDEDRETMMRIAKPPYREAVSSLLRATMREPAVAGAT